MSSPVSSANAQSAALSIAEADLPVDLSPEEAVESAYASVLAEAAGDLTRGLPVLIECDKDLMPYLFMNIRGRLRQQELRCLFLDGRPREGEEGMASQMGLVGTMLAQLRDAVRGAVERRVVVLPHLDLLTTGQGGLTGEAREAIALLYENPELVWLGFKDLTFAVPKVIENLFPKRYQLLGIQRDTLPALITQSESRKFGESFNPWELYKYVSGMNAARLRRVLSTLEGEDYPADAKKVYAQIRNATTGGGLEIPSIDLEDQIGGYKKVKKRLNSEILEILRRKDCEPDPARIRRLEELLPKGMIFWGPPGTGKTLFAKAMATAIGAAITIVSGPELKSRWVGESEERIRQIFHQARQSAPSIIVFDELDSFASARGTYTGSGVEHSMVNQLLTEMDGFHKEELVFVVGTTNFVESLDPALLRPGRFEFHLHIPYPGAEDRREIFRIYDKSMDLEMSPEALDFAVKRTGEYVEGNVGGTLYSGDHINALCRSLARIRLREDKTGPTEAEDVERALTEWSDRPKMTRAEEKVVATHEAGHAVVALFTEHSPPIERISIQGDLAGSLGYVKHEQHAHKYIFTQNQLLDQLAMLMGGREAELLLMDDLSIGSAGDLQHATGMARALVEEYGMGGDEVGVGQFPSHPRDDAHRELSPAQLEAMDRAVRNILHSAKTRAAEILREQKDLVVVLRDLLLDKKVLDTRALGDFLADHDVPRKKTPASDETNTDDDAETSDN